MCLKVGPYIAALSFGIMLQYLFSIQLTKIYFTSSFLWWQIDQVSAQVNSRWLLNYLSENRFVLQNAFHYLQVCTDLYFSDNTNTVAAKNQ